MKSKPELARTQVWMLSLFGLLLMIYHWYFNQPLSNDFSGLGLHCLLIEQEGLKYCINNNWGFAHTGSLYLMTEITGNLLFSQHLLSALFSLLTFLMIWKISVIMLDIPVSRFLYFALFLLASSFFFLELNVSPHLDVIPITLILWGIWRLDFSGMKAIMITGFGVGVSYWFRFHFFNLALLFPFLVFLYGGHFRWRQALWAGIGVVAALMVPHLLTFRAFGKFSISNQKYVFWEMINGYDWSCEQQLQIAKTSYHELWSNLDAIAVFRRIINDITYHQELYLLLLVILIYIFAQPISFWKKALQQTPSSEEKEDQVKKIIPVVIYLIIGVLPFILIRTATSRIVSALMLPIYPFFLAILIANWQFMRGIFLLFALVIFWRDVTQLALYHSYQREIIQNQKLAENCIPVSKLQEEPSRILAIPEFFNPYHRYWITYPALIYSWPCRYEPFFQNFDYIQLDSLGDRPLKLDFDYLILTYPTENTLFDFPMRKVYDQCRVIGKVKNTQILQVN